MSTFVSVGISENVDPFQAGTEAAKVAFYQLRKKNITFCLLFSTVHFSTRKLIEGINYVLGDIKIIGCSGTSIISASGIRKYGVGLMLVSSDKMNLGISACENIDEKGARASGEEFARGALKNLASTQRDMALILPDGLVENASELIRGIKDIVGLSFPIIGGSSADNFKFTQTFQYYNRKLITNGIVGAVFAGKNLFGIGLRHGWKPLGKPHLVTEVKGNVIKTIEGSPAIKIYEDYFGKSREEIEQNLIRMTSYYPLGLYVHGETEYLLRNAIRVDEDGGLVCQGDAYEGSEVRIMMGTKEWALDAATQAAQEAKNSLQNGIVKGAVVFESISRNKLLGRLTGEELSRIKEVLGNVPILGICTYGEQAPLKSLEHYGETLFHNESLAILALGEETPTAY